MESEIVAGLTFGLVKSCDGGATWRWMCEDAIGYHGVADLDYEFTSTGSLFVPMAGGLRVMRDGCTFTPLSGTENALTLAQGGDGALYYGTTRFDSKIYRSTDDGATFRVSSPPGVVTADWLSLEVAPSDPDRLYLTGSRFPSNPPGDDHLLFRSDDAGQSWTPLPVSQLAAPTYSVLEIVGISHTDPNLVFARVSLGNDAIYRSTDGGQTWKNIFTKARPVSFVVRRSGQLVAATPTLGAVRSDDNGETWVDLATPPHINCLAENSAGEVWACTHNFDDSGVPSDGYGIMKSKDLATWTPVLKLQEIQGPVQCAPGTVQRDICGTVVWCPLCQDIECSCASPAEEAVCSGYTPAPGGDDPDPAPGEAGCCNSAPPAPGALLLLLGVGVRLLRPRRR